MSEGKCEPQSCTFTTIQFFKCYCVRFLIVEPIIFLNPFQSQLVCQLEGVALQIPSPTIYTYGERF